jgi:Type ISP C-terminal specificity domain
VPLPNTKHLLLHSAQLGQQIADLLNTAKPVRGLNSERMLQRIGVISHREGKALNPDLGALAITVGWGHPGNEGIVMPGRGKAVEREYTSDELTSIKEGAEAVGLTYEQAIEHLGDSTYDVYLNDTAHWKNIPAKVWDYTIGGYQVIKKWLSYREEEILGRALNRNEVREMTNIARRIAAIALLEPILNENYEAIKGSTYSWHSSE